MTDSAAAAAAPGKIPVVLDINVYLDFIGRGDGRMLFPTQSEIPSSSPAADALALAFDDRYALFASPHILRNISRVMRENGQSPETRERFLKFIAETCELTGGAIVDPVVLDHGIGDHEDNHILALAKDPSVNADVIVSSDHHLTDLGPAWNGRLIMRPRQFTSHMVRSAAMQTHTPAPAQPPVRPKRAAPTAPYSGMPRLSDRFPELRDVHLDRPGIGGAVGRQSEDDRQL
ncbi:MULTISPECIES: PIN domain-containing protein [unclassified Microbacterium]|uniref:PIN domain-containing protein n=1 Tax=unclassified Microbacterium TaxID=2609290 RepID=UPI002883336D|nr:MULTISPECIES: PIN domain-containing protein [unclassified Microbacterium]